MTRMGSDVLNDGLNDLDGLNADGLNDSDGLNDAAMG